MADAKRKRVAGGEPEEGGYVRLTPSVAKFMGGKRYCKESELTLHTLLSHERSMGEISECVQLVRVTVTTLDGKTTTHTLDSEHHEVRDSFEVSFYLFSTCNTPLNSPSQPEHGAQLNFR